MYIKTAEMVTKIAATFKISKMNPCEKLRMNLEQKPWEGQWNKMIINLYEIQLKFAFNCI